MRLGEHRLHLPHLVAAAAERQQIVALHEQPRARGPERGAQPRQFVDRRRRAAPAARPAATSARRARSPSEHRHHIASICLYCRGCRSSRQDPPLVRALRATVPSVLSVELRPPRAELDAAAGMDAWIDTYHAVSGLVARRDVRVPHRQRRRRARRTQPAASRHQPRHGRAARSRRAVPDDEALAASSACRTPSARGRKASGRWSCSAATRSVGPPRCVDARVAAARGDPRARAGALARRLGESARRSGDAGGLSRRRALHRRVLPDAGRLASRRRGRSSAFCEELDAAAASTLPGIFGVFYYRSANPKTLETLKQFLPVPVEGLTRGVRGGRDAGRRSARARSARCAPPA